MQHSLFHNSDLYAVNVPQFDTLADLLRHIERKTMLKAHYFATRSRKYVVISQSADLSTACAEHAVKGLREARKIAKEYGAKPHNF